MAFNTEFGRAGQQFQSDQKYFSSYSDVEVHQLMLTDRPRMEAYKNAILQNQHLFKDKVVMDIGAGTGILSLLMAKVGAKKVYSIEASSLCGAIHAVAKDNGYEGRIEAYHTLVEEFVLPDGVGEVDVIVSEWMGFYLLHESMLSSVIEARDRFLSDEGVIFPSEASLYACPCSMEAYYRDHFYFWQNVAGFNLSRVADLAHKAKQTKPEVCEVRPDDLLAEPVCMKTFDLRYVSNEDIGGFSCTNFVGIAKNGLYQGLAIWFTCDFDGRQYDEDGREIGKFFRLSTSPFDPLTHWKQTVIILGPIDVFPSEGGGDDHSEGRRRERLRAEREQQRQYAVEADEVVGWRIEFERSVDNQRRYNITLEMLDPEENEHPIPCSCPVPKCAIIAKMMEIEEAGG